MAHKMQAKCFIWCLPEELRVFSKGLKKLVSLDVARDSTVLYFMRNCRELSRIVLAVCSCCLEFDFGL